MADLTLFDWLCQRVYGIYEAVSGYDGHASRDGYAEPAFFADIESEKQKAISGKIPIS